MQHIVSFSEPDMLLHLNDDVIVDHRAAATLALQHHWKGDLEAALVWERLAIFLRISEAYIFDDEAGARQRVDSEGALFKSLENTDSALHHAKSDRLYGSQWQLAVS